MGMAPCSREGGTARAPLPPPSTPPASLRVRGAFKQAAPARPPRAAKGKRPGQGELSASPALDAQGRARSGTLTRGKGLPSPPLCPSQGPRGRGRAPGTLSAQPVAGLPLARRRGPEPPPPPPPAPGKRAGRGSVRFPRREVGSGTEPPPGVGTRWGGSRGAKPFRKRPGFVPLPRARRPARAPQPLSLCRPPGGPDEGGGGGWWGGCASHRLLWPFCFAGGFRCRDARGVTWGFLPPRWS